MPYFIKCYLLESTNQKLKRPRTYKKKYSYAISEFKDHTLLKEEAPVCTLFSQSIEYQLARNLYLV